jgi:hypothetical protein
MDTLGRDVGVSLALTATSTGVDGTVVSAEAVVSVAVGGWVGSAASAATGGREASSELSLRRLDESEPQPPRAHARTATTTTSGQTPELERTVSPLSRDRAAERDLTCLSLFAHGAESSLKRA